MSTKENTQVTSIDDEPDAAVVAAAAAPAPRAKGKAAAASAATPDAVDDEAPARLDTDLSGKRVMLTIHASPGDGGNDAVFVGINGVGSLVPRGTPWNVPSEFVDVLKQATQDTYITDGRNTIERKVPRYAYTVEPI